MKQFISILTLLLIPFVSSSQGISTELSLFQFDDKNFFAVANAEYRVVKLDADGDLVQSFGKRGRGPGEFQDEYLNYVLNDSLLYITDGIAQKIVVIDKDSFELRDEIMVKKNVSNLILHQDEVYGIFFNYDKFSTFDSDYKVISVRPLNKLQNKKATLFEIKEPYEINPLYDQFRYSFSDYYSVIISPFKNKFYLFDGNTLESINIPFIEEFSLGDLRNDHTVPPNLRHQFVENLSPAYVLIRSTFIDGNIIYFHVQSFKNGNALISYDVTKREFMLIGTLRLGKIMGIHNETVFTFYKGEVIANSLADIRSCSEKSLSIFLSADASKKDCHECSSSLNEWFEFANTNYIPVKIFIEDTSWFGKMNVTANSIQKIQDWGIWGEINYTKECNTCFESEISVQLPDSEKLIPLPASLPIAQKHFSCLRD
jgi:hypothetical protein